MDPKPVQIVRASSPELLSHSELVQLVETPKPEVEPLKSKFETLLRTPFINNEVYYRNGQANPPLREHSGLGKGLRITTWNIEKSVRARQAAELISADENYLSLMRPEFRAEKTICNDACRQRADLAASDVLLLQEMDIGHCRSGYLFAAQHLAQEMGMNYVYAPQQLEIDPVYLGTHGHEFENQSVGHQACQLFEGDKAEYRGVFGVAVLSRFPIKRVQAFQLESQPYSWYDGEIKKADLLEQTRRAGSTGLFKFRPVRELKVGGRSFTRVDLHVPDLPEQTLTIINVHLEIKTSPKGREEQMKEILSYIKDISNPVVMAGDHNSSPVDVSSTSFLKFGKHATTNPANLLSAGLYFADITGVSQARTILNSYKNFRDPLAWDVPVLLPNRVKGLFRMVEDFRFDDGGAFDFRGDPERSKFGYSGKLSNANQRHNRKGFTFTFSVPRPIGPIGRQRLDWIFVKSFLTAPEDPNGSYALAPHFGETLSLMNLAMKEPISDHHPITVVLPLEEPTQEMLKNAENAF